ncbi:MAG: carrier protein 1 [Pseudomonadota bacterium]|jgi:AAA family ATP:ADP antiporter
MHNDPKTLNEEKPFGQLRNFFWPVHRHEHRKLVPLFVLFLLIPFIYHLLRCMKVALVVGGDAGSHAGASVIPFLKVWGVLPGAVVLTYFFTLLANRFNRAQVFYIVVLFFLSFFACFTLFLHPNHQLLELVLLPEWLSKVLPQGFQGLIAAIRYWPTSLFYILSELWGSVIIAMLLWGYVNEVTTLGEAKRFYAIFTLAANMSGIFSGQVAQLMVFKEVNVLLPFGNTAWEQTVLMQIALIMVLGAIILGLFWWLNKYVFVEHQASLPATKLFTRKKKNAISLMASFQYLARSRYMLYIAVIVVGYNIVYNLADVVWTDQMNIKMAGDSAAINRYMNNVTSITGIFATFSALFLSGNVIRRFGWKATAMITPLIWLAMGIGVFGCMMFQANETVTGALLQLFGLPIQSLILLFGSAQICLGRASKYTVFDESKEIAFIPLSKEEQRKGKAVVDGIGSRFGKAGGSLLIQILLVTCLNLSNALPYIAVLFFVVLFLWIYAVQGLGNCVKQSVDRDQSSNESADTPADISMPLGQIQNLVKAEGATAA